MIHPESPGPDEISTEQRPGDHPAEAEGPPEEAGPKKKSGTIRLLVLFAIASVFYLVFKYTDAGYYFQRPFIEKTLDSLGAWAPVGYVAIYSVGTLLGVPGTLLTALGGIVFGPYLGTTLVVLGATIGACLAFSVTRFLARDFVLERFGQAPWFRKMEDGIRRRGVYFVLFIRLVPLFPFNGINFASGLTNVRFIDYLLGTFIGIIPASFVFTNAAYELAGVAAGGRVGMGTLVALTLLGLLAAIPMFFGNGMEKKEYKDKETSAPPDNMEPQDNKANAERRL